MRSALLIAVVAGCGQDGDSLPIVPGGGGGTGGTHAPDASLTDGGAGAPIAGRACLVADVGQLSACASTGAGGLEVSLGGQGTTATATTADDGSFTVTSPGGADLVWRVRGAGIMSSAMRAGSSAIIPVVPVLVYADMLAVTNATVVTGDGALVARVARGGTPVSGAVVSATPSPGSAVYYAGGGPLDWNVEATGVSGTAWIPSIASGAATLSVSDGGGAFAVAGVPVFADTVTFESIALP